MSTSKTSPSEVVKTTEGRHYHLDLAPGELADYILLCVDPARARRVSEMFDEVTFERSSREFQSFTGICRGNPISVICTGIGQDNIEIVFVEVLQLFEGKRPTFIRIGSCGGLKPDVVVGDLVVTTASVRLENTSTHYVYDGYPAVAHHEAVQALITAADKVGFPYHVGLAASASGFFGAQGREVAGLKPRDPDVIPRLASWNVLDMEMETSTLFTLGNLAGVRTGNVGVVYSNRASGEWIRDDQRTSSDAAAERVGLEAIHHLVAIDAWKVKHQKTNYVPQMLPGMDKESSST